MSLSLRDRLAIGLLATISFFLFADQNLMAPNLTQMAEEFGFTPEERDVKLGGDISLIFWLLGGVVTLLVGYWTDRTSRKKLFTVIVLIGEIPCLLTGFAETYTQLFWLRALTGIGIGGALPLVYSLIGDYYPAHKRATATAYIGLAMGLGIAIGQLVAGFLGPTYGWRLPFIVVALPNFILGLIFWFGVREPARGRTETQLKALIEQGVVYTGKIDRKAYRALFSVRTNLLVFVQGIFNTVPWGVFFIFLNDFFAQDKGYTVEAATLIVTATGGAAILGSFLGGLVGNGLYNRNPRYLPLLCGATTILGVVPTALLIGYPAQFGVASPDVWGPLGIGFLAGAMIAVTAPNVRAILLNVNAPETRGSIFSLYNLADDLGRGFGPVIISALIVAFGRLTAFHIANLFWVVGGIFLLLMYFTFAQDEARLAKKLDTQRADMMNV